MKDLNKNRKGYKHTSVGWIPEDWTTLKIKDFAETTAGGTPSTSKAEYWDGDIMWMSSGDLNMKRVYKVEGRITELGLKKSSTRLIPPRSILIGLAGQGKTRGTVAMNMIELCTNQSVAAVLPNDSFRPEYLYYNLDYRYQELRRLSTGDGGRGGLNLGIIDSIIIPFPSLQEQDLIVKTISLWDKLITDTEKLVSTKEKLKKGLMQQLLTGKKRLPGFNEKWKEYLLGSLGDTFSGLSGKSKDDFGFGKPYIPYLNIFNNSKIDITNFDYVNIEKGENQNRVKYGDIFFTVSSETPDEVGMASVLLDDIVELYLNSFCFGFRLKDFNVMLPDFSSYFFRCDEFRKELNKLSQGATRFNLSKNNLMKLKILLPLIDEQQALANIFQGIDKEIDLLKSQLELYRLQKKGLMQVLLTGAVRVKV